MESLQTKGKAYIILSIRLVSAATLIESRRCVVVTSTGFDAVSDAVAGVVLDAAAGVLVAAEPDAVFVFDLSWAMRLLVLRNNALVGFWLVLSSLYEEDECDLLALFV
jgi:hypothetical protein